MRAFHTPTYTPIKGPVRPRLSPPHKGIDTHEEDHPGGPPPLALERLGQLYDAKGDTENAALYYAQFVDMWENADSELQPRVAVARARLEEIIRERG